MTAGQAGKHHAVGVMATCMCMRMHTRSNTQLHHIRGTSHTLIGGKNEHACGAYHRLLQMAPRSVAAGAPQSALRLRSTHSMRRPAHPQMLLRHARPRNSHSIWPSSGNGSRMCSRSTTLPQQAQNSPRTAPELAQTGHRT